jgi:signal transduction histidine kinase
MVQNVKNTINNIKSQSMIYLAAASTVTVFSILIVAVFFSKLLPQGEVPPIVLIPLCIFGIVGLLLSIVSAYHKKLVLSYSLFLIVTYVGAMVAIFSGESILPIQNTIILFCVPLVMATFLFEFKEVLVTGILSVILLNGTIVYLNYSPLSFFGGYVFYHLFCVISLWIALVKVKIDNTLHTSIAKDAKLKEIGFITGSIAHEINSPLLVIQQAFKRTQKIIDKIQSENIADSKDHINQYLQLGASNTKRITNIIKSIYSIAKEDKSAPPPLIPLSKIQTELVPIIEDLKHTYDVEFSTPLLKSGNIFIEAYETEIIQILYNLLRNACITLCDDSNIENKKVALEIEMADSEVKLHVKDSGPGLPDKIKDQMGNALNSGTSHGLGLGLSISMSLAAKNNSSLDYSEPNGITTFTLSIPKPGLPNTVTPDSVIAFDSDIQAHYLLLKEDFILIYMRSFKDSFEVKDIKRSIEVQKNLVKKVPYSYVVVPRKFDLPLEAKMYFNSDALKKLFISGAIVGNSKAVISTNNMFTNFLKLPYPVKMFLSTDEAIEWTKKLNQS